MWFWLLWLVRELFCWDFLEDRDIVG